MNQLLFKILFIIIKILLVLFFLNIRIEATGDIELILFDFQWRLPINYWLIIFTYVGIFLTFVPSLKFLNKVITKYYFFKFIGVIILWVVFLIYSKKLSHLQRWDFWNPQFLFVLTTILLLIFEILYLKMSNQKNNNNDMNEPCI